MPNFGLTPLSTTSLGTNQFPVSAGFVPNTASGNLTSLQLGPASTDNNGYISAPVATYTPDGNDVTAGSTTDVAVTGDVSGSISAKLRGLSKIFAQLQFDGSNNLKINVAAGTLAATQSGTWNINNISGTISLPTGAAADSSINGILLSQASTTSGQKGPLIQGAVTTSSPSYTTAQTSPLSLTTAGALRVDASSTTQPISAASLPLPTGAATSAKQPALGTAGSASTDVLTVQGIASMTPFKVDGSGVTQPISGTITANAGTGNFTVVQATGSNLHAVLDSGSTTTVTQATGTNLHTVIDSGTITATTNADTTIGGTSAPSKGLLAIGKTNDGTPQYQPLPEGTGGRSVIVEGYTGGTAVPVSGTFWQTTQPISGTITANIGTTNGLALDTSVNGLLLSQGSTTSGEKGPLVQGAVTTNAPTYTTAQTSPLSLDTSGLLRVSIKDTPSNTNNLNVALAASSATVTVSSSGNFNNASVSSTGSAVPSSASYIGANKSGNLTGLSLDGSGNLNVNVAAGSSGNAAASSTGSAVPTDADYIGVNVAGNLRGQTGVNPSGSIYAGQIDFASVAGTTTDTNSGNKSAGTLRIVIATDQPQLTNALKVDGSGVTQPVSGTVTANQGGSNWSTNVAQIGGTNVVTGGASGLLAVGGPVASGSSNADNPLKIGGAFNTTQPTVTTGQIVDAQMTSRGAQIVATGVDTFTVTANAGTNLNTSALALESGGNLATLAGGVSSSKYQANIAQIGGATPQMDNTHELGVSLYGKHTTAGDTAVSVDSSGNVNTNVIGALPAGSATIGAVTQASGPWTSNVTQIAGSSISTATTGVQKVGIVGNSGATVDSTIGAGSAPTNALVVGSVYNSSAPAPTSGQAMALQSDQAGNMRNFPGMALATLSAWNSSTTLNSTQTIFTNSGASAVLVQLTQTTTLSAGAITFEASYDGSNWSTIPANCVLDPTSATFAQISLPYTVQASTNKAILLNSNGMQALRIKLSTVITGTGTVTPNYALLPESPADTVIALSPTATNFNVAIGAALPGGSNVIGAVTQSGTWTIQPGNTPNTSAWLVQDVAGTSGGATTYHLVSASGTNATNVKSSAGLLYGYSISNTNSSARFVHFYNTSSNPTVGTTTPVATVQVPGNGVVIRAFPVGATYGTGISFGTSTGAADNDSGSVGAGDLVIDLEYH